MLYAAYLFIVPIGSVDHCSLPYLFIKKSDGRNLSLGTICRIAMLLRVKFMDACDSTILHQHKR